VTFTAVPEVGETELKVTGCSTEFDCGLRDSDKLPFLALSAAEFASPVDGRSPSFRPSDLVML